MAFSVYKVFPAACQSRSWFVLYVPGSSLGVRNKPTTRHAREKPLLAGYLTRTQAQADELNCFNNKVK